MTAYEKDFLWNLDSVCVCVCVRVCARARVCVGDGEVVVLKRGGRGRERKKYVGRRNFDPNNSTS